jgi:prophage DNA circulation protein
MQQDIAATCQDIEDTRSAITEKLEILEERVRETVEGAQSSVEDIVENVKDMVDTTVEAVRHGAEGAQSTVEGIVENIRETVGDTVETVKRTLYEFPLNMVHRTAALDARTTSETLEGAVICTEVNPNSY